MTTTLYLARHGETEENVAQILRGHLPGHLTERGRNQAIQLRNTLVQSGVSFDALLTSDLQRTIDTTQIVNEAFHLQPMLCPSASRTRLGQPDGTYHCRSTPGIPAC